MSRNQQAGINRRVEEGELERSAGDVLAVAQLVKAVGHRRPVVKKRGVGRNLEVKGLADGNAATCPRASAAAGRPRAANDILDFCQSISKSIERRLKLIEGFVGVRRRRDSHRRWAKKFGGEDVEQGRFAQRLA